MTVTATEIAGLFVVRDELHEDERGFFRQTWQASSLARAIGRPIAFRQNNHSRSRAGVIRGFHAEPLDKLVYVPRGTARCAVADIRPESPTFGLALTFLLGDEPGERIRLFISEGLANAFEALTECDYINDVTHEYVPGSARGIAWNDPTFGVPWTTATPILSPADASLPTLADLVPRA